MKKQLIDTFIFQPKNVKRINESTTAGINEEFLYFEGVIQRFGVKNINGRVYPENILKSEVDRYIREKVNTNFSYGEIDHPEYNEVKLKYSSHLITKLWWEDNELYGRFKVLKGVNGQILRDIVDSGGALGVSSRAVGDVKNQQFNEGERADVVTELDLICWDFVSSPSTQGAIVKPVSLHESINVNKIFNNKNKLNNMLTKIINTLSE